MAARKNMFLSMMQEKDAAASRGGSRSSASAPVSPPTGSESGSARSLPAIRGAEPPDNVDPLGTSQPLPGDIRDSPSSPQRAQPAWEDQRAAATGRSQPGMRYEIYDFSTAELRAELANCRRQPDTVGWRDWANWITDELDERVAGEDIFSAIANLAEGCELDDNESCGDTGADVGAAGSMPARGVPVAPTPGESPKRRMTAPRQQSGEAEERRHRAAELNRTSGGARRNALKKHKKKLNVPAWVAQQDVPPQSEGSEGRQSLVEPPRMKVCASPQRPSQPNLRPSVKAQPATELEMDLLNVRLQQPPSGHERRQRGQPSENQAQVARKSTNTGAQQPQQREEKLDLAVVGTEPRHSVATPHQASCDDLTAALVERSASLDKRMEEERQQVWLQQQAAEAEAARQALVSEQERNREREQLQREREQADVARLAREREEERLRQQAKEKARLEAERRREAAAAEAERRKEQQAAAARAKAQADAVAREAARAEAEARRQREAEEVAQLEEESNRRIEEARQIKAAMLAAKQRKEEAVAVAAATQEVETNECFEVRHSATRVPVTTATAGETDAEAAVGRTREAGGAAEVAKLEQESQRRIDEARQIKAAIVAAKQRKEISVAEKPGHAAVAMSAVHPEPQPMLQPQRQTRCEPEPEPEPEKQPQAQPQPQPQPQPFMRSVFSRPSVDKLQVRRSSESPTPVMDGGIKSSAAAAELEIHALRQRAAEAKERREELQARAAKRQDQVRKSAELANPRGLGGSESPLRSGAAVADGRRSRNSKASDFVLNSAGQMVKSSGSQDARRGSTEPEGKPAVSQSMDSCTSDEDEPAPLQAPPKQKPVRVRRSSAAVLPPRELSESEKLISGHYPTLAQIFGAAHMNTTEPFNLPECVSAAQRSIEKWKGLVEELDGVRETPRQLCYCVQPKDHKKETDVYDIVTESAGRLAEWTEIPWERRGDHSFNLLWSWSNPHKGKTGVDASKLLVWQRVNRFPDSKPLTRKDFLKRNLQRYSALPGDLGAAFNCFPETFTLPKDYKDFLAEFNRVEEEEEGSENIWIMKPVGSSRGRGIFLISDLNDVTYSEDMVVQRYIHNPLLIDGFKFDLRLYVCVLSFQPLEAYVHHLGFARYSSAEYTCDKQSLENNFIHLTNSSINNAKSTNAQSGSKQSLDDLWKVLAAKGIERNPVWQRICEVVLRSLFCVVEKMGHHPNCFELFGYDVLIDADLNAHLIEVNSSPALTRQNPLDHDIKGKVITDTIRLVTPPAFDRAKLSELLLKSSGGDERGNRPTFKQDLVQKLEGVLGEGYHESGPRLMDHVRPSEARLGGFEQIAPSKTYDAICRPFGRARPR